VARFHVCLQRAYSAVALAAVLTHIDRSILGRHVLDAVRRQIGGACELSVAVWACVGLGSGVDALVHTQLGQLSKARRASLALERTISAVNTLVHGEMRATQERLATHSTHVRPEQHETHTHPFNGPFPGLPR